MTRTKEDDMAKKTVKKEAGKKRPTGPARRKSAPKHRTKKPAETVPAAPAPGGVDSTPAPEPPTVATPNPVSGT
jgi:hypothetical protein